ELCLAADVEYHHGLILVIFPIPRTKHGKKPLSVSLLRGTERGGFELMGLDRTPDRLLSTTEPLIDPRLVPCKPGEAADEWLKRYGKECNQTGVSLLSLLGRVRNQILVLAHS